MNVLRIAWGDLKWVGKDPQAVLWMLVMPLVLAFLLGSMFRSTPSQPAWIPIVDLDQSELSRLFCEQMGEDCWVAEHPSSGEHLLQSGTWSRGVVIPPGFEESLLKGERVNVTVVTGRESLERILDVQSRVARGIVRFTKGLALADVSRRPWNDDRKAALKECLSRPPLVSVERKGHRSLLPPPLGFYLSLPGFLVMFVLLSIIVAGGLTLAEDRARGRFARLMAAPVNAFEIYVGKILSRVLMALVQALLLLVSGSLLFQIRLGDSPAFLLPVILSLAFFAGCLSMLCGLVCRTEKQVLHVGIFVAVVLAALGGCWWPIEVVPGFFKLLAMFTPSYWGMHGLQRVMYFNKSYEVLTLECPILLGYAAAVILAALPFLRRWQSQPVGG